MPEARHEVTIRRPASAVFEFIADGSTGPSGGPGSSISPMSPGAGSAPPTSRASKVQAAGASTPTIGSRPTSRTPRLAFEAIAGPVRPKGEYTLEETDGSTILTFALAAELTGIKKLLMGGAVQKTMDAEVQATERLKSVLESTPAG